MEIYAQFGTGFGTNIHIRWDQFGAQCGDNFRDVSAMGIVTMTIADNGKIGATNDNVLVFGTRDLKYAYWIDGILTKNYS